MLKHQPRLLVNQREVIGQRICCSADCVGILTIPRAQLEVHTHRFRTQQTQECCITPKVCRSTLEGVKEVKLGLDVSIQTNKSCTGPAHRNITKEKTSSE